MPCRCPSTAGTFDIQIFDGLTIRLTSVASSNRAFRTLYLPTDAVQIMVNRQVTKMIIHQQLLSSDSDFPSSC